MRDGHTRKVEVQQVADGGSFSEFAANWQASLVILSGGAVGEEFALEQRQLVVGRGEGADLRFDDRAMSKEHAVLEFADTGYRIRDLGSMNSSWLNGGEVRLAELKHGDRIQLGEHVFQFVLEKRRRRPKTYEIPDL